MPRFCHLHCHTQYSLLDGAARVDGLISQAKILGMEALAITDHGNMFGVLDFVTEAKKQGIKPIIGCEFYVAPDRHDHTDKTRYHQLILASNAKGYENLIRLCSLGYTEGYYYKPRIDKKLIQKYKEGLIATTCCLAAEVPKAILSKGEEAAEKVLLDWIGIFGKENYYIELQRHGLAEQDRCNEVLIRWSRKHGVKMIATNDVHYTKQEDSKAHDILLCLQTGADLDDPKRMRFANDQFFLKSPEQMATLFADVPEAISNTAELADRIAEPVLERDLLLPAFALPKGFKSQDRYLKHLVWAYAESIEGGKKEVFQKRIAHELDIIEKMGYAGYFLIVQDLVHAAKKLGVVVGPGRGSVAGSLVAYCLGITTINPLAYQLIFERFLNPDRISMPDIDLDFDDKGRERLIAYLVDKYGHNQVAQIITFGSMGAKTAIRDVARVLKLPLKQADYLAKLIPDKPGITFQEAFESTPELVSFAKKADTPEGRVLAMATTLEGCIRHAGIHAAGLIIAPGELTDYIPVRTDKKSNLLVTQYEGALVEKAGMLKMDLLGLRTLSIMQDAVSWIKKNHGVEIDLGKLPLNDEKTFKLFQKGSTIAVFQFESEGMRKWLEKLRPTHIEDLIAMNALYRPGPMQFIPNFIDRKNGKEKVDYPHAALVEILQPTYGIMVYQEQIMQTAQIIANYTLAQADVLRYAMGKKKVKEMAKQRTIFIENAQKKQGISKEKAVEIFDMMEKFSRYGFNRSHSVAYALIAYQTAFLKVHYPAEFMASVLTHHQHDLDKIAFFIQECKRLKLTIQGPDVNLSDLDFSPNASTIRFGLAAIKDVGKGAVELIVEERKKNGPFEDIYDFTRRLVDRKINKKMVERLAMVGAFDGFKPFLHRKQYVFSLANEGNLIARSLQEAKKLHESKQSKQLSLFAAEPEAIYHVRPKAVQCEPYTQMEKLRVEKELVGFYVSGHPLDYFKKVLERFANCHTQNVFSLQNQEVKLAGVVEEYKKRQNKSGGYYGSFSIEDYQGRLSLQLFGEKLTTYEPLLVPGHLVYIVGRVQPRYGQKDVWQLKIKNIEPLEQIAQKYTKSVSVTLAIHELSQELVEGLSQTVSSHPGACKLYIWLVDHTAKMKLGTFSTTCQVGISADFLVNLNKLNVLYRLN
ncbi:MAG: DNA polymerase III subunit alpha [Bacteroidota bacterium]